MNFEHLCIPLILQEAESGGEGHGLEGFGCGVAGYLQFNKVSLSVERLACDGTLSCHSQLLHDETLFKDVSITKNEY